MYNSPSLKYNQNATMQLSYKICQNKIVFELNENTLFSIL
jgi:hypothetical protein